MNPLDFTPSDFNAYLAEMYPDGGGNAGFLRQQYREKNNFTNMLPDGGLADGRQSVAGGFASKDAGATGRDAMRSLRPAIWNGIRGLLQGGGEAVQAPLDAYRGLLSPDEMTGAAMGTAGMAMGGGLAASGRGLLDYDPNTTNIFAGRNAKTADQGAADRAESMLANGADRGDVWRETGWMRGVDGQMRFEIDDSRALYKNAGNETVSKLGDILDHPELYNAYPDAKNTDLAVMQLDGGTRGQYMAGASFDDLEKPKFGAIALDNQTAAGDGGKSTLLHEVQHGVQRSEGFDGGSNGNLGQYQARNYGSAILRTPEAKKQADANREYDFLKEEGATLWRALTLDSYENLTKRGSAGTLKPRDITGNSEWYKISHEYRSTNGAMPKKPGPARDDWLHGAAIRMRQTYLEGIGGASERQVKGLRDYEYTTPRDRKNAEARLDRKMDKVRKDAFKYSQTRERAQDYIDMSNDRYRSYEAYTKNSGEAEARNTQARLDLLPEERLNELPWETSDIPFNKQIPGTAVAGQELPNFMADQRQQRRGLLE